MITYRGLIISIVGIVTIGVIVHLAPDCAPTAVLAIAGIAGAHQARAAVTAKAGASAAG